jgi:hypothetical protein
MKIVKSNPVPAPVLILVFILAVVGQESRAESASNEFRIASDVLCGTGGGAQSAVFTLKTSAGAQASPVGPQSSAGFSVGGGWIYTAGSEFIRGDAYRDDKLDVGDVVWLLNYLFKSGPAPCPKSAGDANCDGELNLADAIYLLNYLFRGGPAPCPGGKGEAAVPATVAKPKADQGHAQVWLSLERASPDESRSSSAKPSSYPPDQMRQIWVLAKFDRDLAGMQLEIEFDPTWVSMFDPALTPLTEGFQLFCGTEANVQRIGIVDLSGQRTLPAGEEHILTLSVAASDLYSIKIRKALLVDTRAAALTTEAWEELETEMKKPSESRPEHFSLSQNYPNPFNPRTSISYALPGDAHVRLCVYNVLGRKVAQLVDEPQTAGYKTVWWDGTDQHGDQVASGVYFYRLEAGEFFEVRKMMLVK